MTSKIKVDNITNQSDSNIVNKCGTTITLGASGDTITLACGASQTGFGRTGTVDWDTTAKTTSFTAVSGNGYFCDTTSAAFTVTLPATPSAGDIVAIADYANTSATNNITVGRNSVNIDGEAVDATIKINGQVYTLVYVDATEGWKTVGQTFNQINTAEFVAATGGTVTCCGDYKIHTFTGPGTFTVTNAGNPAGSSTVDYMVVAGGGGAPEGVNSPDYNYSNGGGGAGGFRYSASTYTSPACAPGHPLRNPTGVPVTATGYPITVGAGGAGGAPGGSYGNNGSNSIFSTITSTGGGRGGVGGSGIGTPGTENGNPGGSGGAGGAQNQAGGGTLGGSGNTPPVSPSQGNAGGKGTDHVYTKGGGGGGAISVGGNAGNLPAPTNPNPNGGGLGGAGAGLPSAFGASGEPSGPFYYFAGGGGGGAGYNGAACGSVGGSGGIGGGGSGSVSTPGTSGTTNTGGGGGGTSAFSGPNSGGAGGSGIVVIRYKFQ